MSYSKFPNEYFKYNQLSKEMQEIIKAYAEKNNMPYYAKEDMKYRIQKENGKDVFKGQFLDPYLLSNFF